MTIISDVKIVDVNECGLFKCNENDIAKYYDVNIKY